MSTNRRELSKSNRYRKDRLVTSPGPYENGQVLGRLTSLKNVPVIPDKAYGRIP